MDTWGTSRQIKNGGMVRRLAAVTLVTLSLVVVQQAGVALPGYEQIPQVSSPRGLAARATVYSASGQPNAGAESAWEAYASMVAAATEDPPSPPQPEDGGFGSCSNDSECPGVTTCISNVCYVPKNRYLSFSAGDAGRLQAVRVTLVDLPVPYDTWNGVQMWVGEPAVYCENSGLALEPPGGCPFAGGLPLTFVAATLQCDPFFMDWSTVGVFHVYHEGVIPDASYAIHVTDDVATFSDPLELPTAPRPAARAWGDIAGAFSGGAWSPPDGRVNFDDVYASLDTFQNMFGRPPKVWADVEPQTPDQLANITDVTALLGAFRGDPYPPPGFPSPSPPPCTLIARETIIASDHPSSQSSPAAYGTPVAVREPGVTNTARGWSKSNESGRLLGRTRTLPSEAHASALAPGPQISLVPVDASGAYLLIGDEIILFTDDQTVYLDIYLSGWDEGLTGTPRLIGFNAKIDSAGYSSGAAGVLSPVTASQETARTDWIFVYPPRQGLAATFIDPGGEYEWMAALLIGDPLDDDGTPKYGGTLELDVPSGAMGTFTVGFKSILDGYGIESATYLAADSRLHIDVDMIPARITIMSGLAPPDPEDTGWGDCIGDWECPEMPCVGGKCYITKNRYISFVPRNPGRETALRVTLTGLPEQFDELNGQTMWVGEPSERTENSGKLWPEEAPDYPTFWGARLECSWHCRDWSTVGLLHVTDDEIVPDAVYHVQAIDCATDPENEENYSDPLIVPTGQWGDVCGKFLDGEWWPPDGDVTIPYDVTAMVEKFKNLDGALIKARSDTEPNFPDWKVNMIDDITLTVDAFRGCPYPARAVDPPPWCPVWPGGPTGCP